MNVVVYVLCYNEIKIFPFVVDYWKQYASKVIVYDNGSNDGILDEFKKYDWIEVRHFDSDGMNDQIHIDIKNHCWKECRGKGVDYVQVSDFDEVLWSPNIIEDLKKHKENGDTIFSHNQYLLVTQNFPVYNGELLNLQSTTKFLNGGEKTNKFDKAILFSPDDIKEINYNHGCHTANPQGNVKSFKETNIKHFHIVNLGLEYIIWKYGERAKRLSQKNIIHGWGSFYNQDVKHITEVFESNIKTAKYCIDDLSIKN